MKSDPPFDMEREKREPLWGDPTSRKIPGSASQEEIDVNLLALELLDEAVSQIRVKLVPALHGYLKRFVGSCTGKQYREIRYGAGHTLSVFSSEKGDFLSPAEQSRTIRDGLALCMQAAAAGLPVGIVRLLRPDKPRPGRERQTPAGVLDPPARALPAGLLP